MLIGVKLTEIVFFYSNQHDSSLYVSTLFVCIWVSEWFTSHQQRGHKEMGPLFRNSSERPEKRGIDLAIPELVV